MAKKEKDRIRKTLDGMELLLKGVCATNGIYSLANFCWVSIVRGITVVIPAQAGIQRCTQAGWVPACAGMTVRWVPVTYFPADA